MAIRISRGESDDILDRIKHVLQNYEHDHPEAEIELYRQNPVSVRVRIIDPSFAGMTRTQRSQLVWRYLDPLSEEEQSDISMLLLLTPQERTASFANVEFDDPVPSIL